MMSFVGLPLRNLMRNRRRSLATLVAIVVGTMAMLLFGGYRAAITYGLQISEVRRLGHFQVQRQGYFLYGSGNPVGFGIRDYERVIDGIRRDPVLGNMVNVVAPILHFGGLAGNSAAGVSRTIAATGLAVAEHDEMQRWTPFGVRSSRAPIALLDTPVNSAVIGVGVARSLRLCEPLDVPGCTSPPVDDALQDASAPLPADLAALAVEESAAVGRSGGGKGSGESVAIEVLAATGRGAPNVARLAVVGARSQGVKELDDIYVEMHLEQAQRLLYGNEKPEVTAVAVQLKRTADMVAARARLDALLRDGSIGSGLEVRDFMTLSPTYGQTNRLFAAIFGFISTLIASIVLFMIGNTMSMAVLERTVEIGTLRAMGMRRSGVARLFLGEAALLGAIGVCLGIVLSLAVAAAVNNGNLTWTPPGRMEPVPLTLRVWGEHELMITVAVILVLASLLSAWLPSRRAARTNIVDALRHV